MQRQDDSAIFRGSCRTHGRYARSVRIRRSCVKGYECPRETKARWVDGDIAYSISLSSRWKRPAFNRLGHRHLVVPDFTASARARRCLLVEWESHRKQEDSRLNRYAAGQHEDARELQLDSY